METSTGELDLSTTLACFAGCSSDTSSDSEDLARFLDVEVEERDLAFSFPLRGEEGPGCSRDEEGGTGATASLVVILAILELFTADESRGTGISESLEGNGEDGANGIGEGGRRRA